MVIITAIALGFAVLLTVIAVMCSVLYYYRRELTKHRAKKGKTQPVFSSSTTVPMKHNHFSTYKMYIHV